MPTPQSPERFSDAARLQRSFQFGFRLGAVVAALVIGLGFVVLVSSPADLQGALWVVVP